MVMKKRRMSGRVTVTGPPEAICFLKMGMTLPLEPRTWVGRQKLRLNHGVHGGARSGSGRGTKHQQFAPSSQ
jgi:hypothetical protein